MSYGTSYSDTTGGLASDTYLGGGGGFSGNGDGNTTTGASLVDIHLKMVEWEERKEQAATTRGR